MLGVVFNAKSLKTKLLDLLDSDYGDLHGMGMEYLMQFFDEYLGEGKRT